MISKFINNIKITPREINEWVYVIQIINTNLFTEKFEKFETLLKFYKSKIKNKKTNWLIDIQIIMCNYTNNIIKY